MVEEILRIGRALGLSDGGLLKIARDVSHDGALLSVNHMRKSAQLEMLDFLRQIAAAEHAYGERFDRMIA